MGVDDMPVGTVASAFQSGAESESHEPSYQPQAWAQAEDTMV